jgi:predicted ATPase
MQIESLWLKNFPSFIDITFRDIPRFCVLVGANGTGKGIGHRAMNYLIFSCLGASGFESIASGGQTYVTNLTIM